MLWAYISGGSSFMFSLSHNKNFHFLSLLIITSSAILFSCSSDTGNDPSPTPTPTPEKSELVLQFTDERSIPIDNASVLVDGDASPLGNTDVKGEIIIESPSGKTLLVTDNSGANRFAPTTFVKPDWFSDGEVIELSNLASAAGQVDVTLNGVLSDQQAMSIAFNGAGLGGTTAVNATTPITNYSIAPRSENFDLVVTPSSIDTLPQDTFFAIANDLYAPSNTTLPVQLNLAYGGKQFIVNVTNGFPNSIMLAGYRLYNQPYDQHLLAVRTIQYSDQDTISNQSITVPANNTNAVEYSALIGVSIGDGMRITRKLFNSKTELSNSDTSQNITLRNFGISNVTPVNGAVNVNRHPLVQWQLQDTSVSFVTVVVFVGSTVNKIWQAHLNPQETEVRFPDSLPALEPNYTYQMQVWATKLFKSDGQTTLVEITRTATVNFETGNQ
jgi:hypothetical protein